jgi:hypothetical protein
LLECLPPLLALQEAIVALLIDRQYKDGARFFALPLAARAKRRFHRQVLSR